MNDLPENEYLLLGNRIRRFTERLFQEEQKVYQAQNINIPIRWMRVLNALNQFDRPLSITEIARNLNRTHPDIHLITVQLVEHNLIKNQQDRKDQRKRLVSLTKQGQELISRLEPIWKATEDATKIWLMEQSPSFLTHLKSLEDSLGQLSYFERINNQVKINFSNQINVKTYKKLKSEDAQIKAMYSSWENSFLPVEELNIRLNNISYNIVNKGGQVFFAHEEDQCIGLAVAQRLSYNLLQLLFLYVEPIFRRKYVGQRLLNEVIKFGQEIGCNQIIAHTNRLLVPIDNLLKKSNFTAAKSINKNYLPFKNLPHTVTLKI